MGKSFIDIEVLKEQKNHFWTVFSFDKIKLVPIHDEMAMGIKRASEWACWCILVWSIKKSIEKLSVRSMYRKFVPSLRQNAFTYRSTCPFKFHIFPLDSKKKTGIQIFENIKR